MRRFLRTPTSNNQHKSHRIEAIKQRLGNVDREFESLNHRLDKIRQEQLDSGYPEQYSYEWEIRETINSVNDRLDELDNQTAQTLFANSQYIKDQIDNLQSGLWIQTKEHVEEQTVRLQESISAETAFQLSRIDQLHKTLAEFEQVAAHQQKIAWQTLAATQELFNYLDREFEYEGQWQIEKNGLSARIAQSHANLENGFSEASLATSQQVYLYLFKLKAKLDQYIQYRENLILSARNLAFEVINLIKQHRRVQAVDLQGTLLPIEIEVDYWSDGQLRMINRQAKRTIHQLQAPAYTLDVEEIKKICDNLMAIKAQIPGVVMDAHIQVLSSQIRFNLAECALAALRTQGYEISYGGYIGSDMRNSYNLGTENLAGSQILVTISKLPDRPLDHNLDIERKDLEALSEYELRQRSNEINEAFNLFGLEVGVMTGPESIFGIPARTHNQTFVSNRKQPGVIQPARIEFQSP